MLITIFGNGAKIRLSVMRKEKYPPFGDEDLNSLLSSSAN
jgi:hypothetical protein